MYKYFFQVFLELGLCLPLDLLCCVYGNSARVKGTPMRVFDSPDNKLSDILDQMQAEAVAWESVFSPQFIAGMIYACECLRNSASNMKGNGVLLNEAVLVRPKK